MSHLHNSKSTKEISVVLLGCGGVGQQLLSHILNTRKLHAAQGVRIAVRAVCDSKAIVIGRGVPVPELDDTTLTAIRSVKASHFPLSSLTSLDELEIRVLDGDIENCGLLSLIESFSRSTGFVVVDCTANEDVVGLLSKVADMCGCIVLANKKPLTCSMEFYDKITLRKRHLRCESTVGAGLPVITALTRFLASGDSILRIVGALSGTLGYVMSGLQEGKSLSSIVQLAKCLGYTEPDPRDDLSGMDVARKALILARCLGWRVNLNDVEVECLFPSEMGPAKMSMEQFMSEGLPALDVVMSNRVASAASNGCVLRYVAIIEEGRCKVGIMELQGNSPLGHLSGSDNLVEIYTRCYKATPFVIQGAGAGNDTTAAGVLADILDLQDLF